MIERGGAVDRKTRAAAARVNEYSDRMNDWVFDQTRDLLARGKMVVVL